MFFFFCFLFRRKKSLKYHPDKAGKDFDAEKWQRFERARDVLSDADARGAYDSARSAALQREAQRQAMDAKRRQMIEDLEARERGVKRPRDSDGPKKNTMSEEERQRLIAAGNRRMEERKRLMREAEERERLREVEKQQKEKKKKASQQQQPQPPERSNHGTGEGSDGKTTIPDIPMADAPNANGAGTKDGDNYDERIANLEQRLKETRARKAEKEARKAARKAEKAGKKEKKTAWKGDHDDEAIETELGREAQETPPPIPDPGVTELQADDKKKPPVSPPSIPNFSFQKPPAPAADPFANCHSDDEI